MKYLLDTNVISQRTKPRPVPEVVSWLQQIASDDLCLSVITIQEVRAGAESLVVGHKRSAVERWLQDDLLVGFRERILPVNVEVADLCGRILVRPKTGGQAPGFADALIAATAIVHGLKLATMDRKHFERLGVELVEF